MIRMTLNCVGLTQSSPVLSNLFDTAGHLVNFSTSWRAAIKGAHGEHAEREPIREVWGQSGLDSTGLVSHGSFTAMLV